MSTTGNRPDHGAAGWSVDFPPALVEHVRGRGIDAGSIVAASRLLARRGDEISLRAVARELGVSAPALYHYIDSGADLLTLVSADIERELADHVAQTVLVSLDLGQATPLIDVACALWEWAHRHPCEFGLFVEQATQVSALDPRPTTSGSASAFGQVSAPDLTHGGWKVHPRLVSDANASCWLALVVAALPRDPAVHRETAAARFLALVEVFLHRLADPAAVQEFHDRVPQLLAHLVSRAGS